MSSASRRRATGDGEGHVAISAFGGSWAAAWRVATGTEECVRVLVGTRTVTIGPFAPEGALVGAWDDLGGTFAPLGANGDVAVQFVPLPMLRKAGLGGN